MKHYDLESAPNPATWLALDKQARIQLAEVHPRAARIKVPNVKGHAPFHAIVENQGPALHCCMPEISRFLGIVIAMYYRDHAPPHFHALYGEHEVTIDIATGEVNGNFPKRALAHVQEWRTLHRDELLNTWTLARASKPLPRIEPLE